MGKGTTSRIGGPLRRPLALLVRTALISLLVPLCVACEPSSRTGIGPGDLAPEIRGTGFNGEPVTLSGLRGKKLTLVNFWATWCGPCLQELPLLQKMHESLSAQGVAVVGVVLDDSADSVAEYREKYKLTYPMIFDPEGNSKRPYEVNGLPESFVLDAEGKVVLLPDPDNGQPVTKLIGPRAWESPSTQNLFKSLIKP